MKRLRRKMAGRIDIERAVIFGSRARGDAKPGSDLDLLLVSKAFEGKTAAERGAPLRIAWDAPVAVDLLCYSPREFEDLRNKPSLVRVAMEEGIEIAA